MKVKLTDLCNIQYGYAFDSGCFTDDESYIPLVRIRDVKRGFSETYYSGKYQEEYILHSGDLLIGMDGEFNIARWKSRDALLNQRVCKVATKEDVCEEYLRFALSIELKEIENRTAFVTVKHLSSKELNKLELNIPELLEQERIADTLSKIEAIIEKRQDELQKLDDLIKARFVEMFGDPLHPVNYKNLGEVALLERGRFSPRPRNDPKYFNGSYPFIQTGDISSSDHRLMKYKQTLNDLGITVSKQFVKGTIVMAIVGATIGATAILERDVYAPDSVIGITPYKYNNIFLETLLQFWQPKLLANAPECARANINLAILEKVPIVDVDIMMQKQFAAFVKQVDKSKVAVQKSLEETQLLFDSLMQKYFG